jgi:CubicO group peptidase (beta-lactamase class C family)
MSRAAITALWRSLALAACSAACAGSPAIAEPTANPRHAEIAEAIAAAMKRHEVPGVSIAVVDNYAIDWAAGFGVTTAGSAQPVTPTTLFQAASISKPVAALGVLRAVELGKLKLDDDVNPRLTSWHIPDSPMMIGRPVTLRRLLSHSAGLNVHGFEGYAHGAPLPTLIQVLAGSPPANSKPVKIEIKPGYMFRYSGGGYSVMQLLLTEATGTPFPDYMRQQVLEPLGMLHSTYQQPLGEELADSAATGHLAKQKPIEGRWHVHPELAAAGLWTTPTDLAQVVIDVAGSAAGRKGKLLSPAMIAEMLTVQSGKYGLGFALNGKDRALAFSHGGSNFGFKCMLIGIPASGQGAVIMTNSDSGSALVPEVLAAVSRVYAWPTDSPPAAKPTSDK